MSSSLLPWRRSVCPLSIVLCCAALCGCLGPTGLRKTRSEYNAAVHHTNDEELLLNLVRLRYAEGPMFLRVTGVNAQFEVGGWADFLGGIQEGSGSRFGSGRLSFADRPTLTFDPRRDPDFTRALLTRIDVETFSLLDAAGWDLQRSLRLFVEEINGVPNAIKGSGPTPADAPEFAEFKHLTGLMQSLFEQRLIALGSTTVETDVPGAIAVEQIDASTLVGIKKAGFGVRPLAGNKGYVLTTTTPVRVLRVSPAAMATPELVDLCRILRLAPSQPYYELEIISAQQLKPVDHSQTNTKWQITTRSLFELMFFLSHAVEPPPQHVGNGLAAITRNPDGAPFDWGMVIGDLFRVRAAQHRPKSAAVAVKYRGYWYFIDDCDIASKTTLALIQEVIRMQKSGVSDSQPVLTLPVGR